jgi:pyruvate formate lyase activating enzyme
MKVWVLNNMDNEEIKGTVFNIQHYSVHDGPGIRTVVFLKGCPLRCKWCSNPESQEILPELSWTKSKCIGCNSCVKELRNLKCKFTDLGLQWNKKAEFDSFDIKCACPSNALHIVGETKSVKDVLKVVERDSVFFGNSNGGITIGGGEPFMQPEFTIGLLAEAKNRHINTAIETSSFTKFDNLKNAAPYLDYIMTDIKIMNDVVHRKYTNVSNKLILENIAKLSCEFPNLTIHIRTPVIPNVNDTEEDIKAIANFIRPLPNTIYELLKYHEFGKSKYEALNRKYELENATLSDELFEHLKEVAADSLGGDRIFQNYFTESNSFGENI